MDINRQNLEKKFWNNFAKKYDPFMKNVKQTYDLLLEKIKKYLDKSKNILEIATGTGNIALELAVYVNKICGCDISPEMIKIATEKLKKTKLNNIEFHVMDAYNIDYAEESFDVVIASNALHIMIHPEKALKSIRNVLKSDGIFITPTYCHGNSLISRTISMIISIAGFKAYQKWSITSFRTFLESNNYKIVDFEIISDKIPLVFAASKKTD